MFDFLTMNESFEFDLGKRFIVEIDLITSDEANARELNDFQDGRKRLIVEV